MPLRLESLPQGVRLGLKVVPNASRTCIIGELDGALKVTVAAPPEKGKANRATIRLLAKVLGLRTNQLALIAGRSAARKAVLITGLSPEQITRRLSAHVH